MKPESQSEFERQIISSGWKPRRTGSEDTKLLEKACYEVIRAEGGAIWYDEIVKSIETCLIDLFKQGKIYTTGDWKKMRNGNFNIWNNPIFLKKGITLEKEVHTSYSAHYSYDGDGIYRKVNYGNRHDWTNFKIAPEEIRSVAPTLDEIAEGLGYKFERLAKGQILKLQCSKPRSFTISSVHDVAHNYFNLDRKDNLEIMGSTEYGLRWFGRRKMAYVNLKSAMKLVQPYLEGEVKRKMVVTVTLDRRLVEKVQREYFENLR